MVEQDLSQLGYVSVIWLILALIIWISNIFTAFILWRSKISREKSEIECTIHSLWNLICTDVAFSLVGLSLFVSMALVLARDTPLSNGCCDVFGFLHTFSFNFAAFGILVGLIERSYNLLKPFAYNSSLRDNLIFAPRALRLFFAPRAFPSRLAPFLRASRLFFAPRAFFRAFFSRLTFHAFFSCLFSAVFPAPYSRPRVFFAKSSLNYS